MTIYFVHIPKTAGVSARIMLSAAFGDRLAPVSIWDDLVGREFGSLEQYDVISGHFGGGFQRLLPPPVRSFTILRDPVVRTVSHYSHVCRDEAHPYHGYVRGQSLMDFIDDPVTAPLIWNLQARYLADASIPTAWGCAAGPPQGRGALSITWEMTTLAIGAAELQQRARNSLDEMEVVGVTERFEESWNTVTRAFGLPQQEPVHANVAETPSERIEIDASTRASIERATAIDRIIYDEALKRVGMIRPEREVA